MHRTPEYLSLIMMSFTTFLMIYVIAGILMPIASKAYRELPGPKFTGAKRVDYLTRVVAIVHAIAVTLIATHACFYSCDSGRSILSDDDCRI